MLSDKTVEILSALNKKELKKFGDFLSSPYFNTRDAYVKIFNVIFEAYPRLDSEAFDYRKMFKKLYPGKVYKERTIKNLYSEFGGLLKKFIGYEGIRNDEKMIDLYTAEGLTGKNLLEISDKFTKAGLNEKGEKLLNAAHDFHYRNKVNINYYNNLIQLRRTGTKEHYEVFKTLHEDLIIFFLRDIFYLATDNIYLRTIFPAEIKYSMLEELMEFVNIKDFLHSLGMAKHDYAPYLKVEYMIYYHTKNNITEEEYYELKHEMLSIIHKIKKVDQTHFISRLTGIILSKLIPVSRKYYSEIFELGNLFRALKIYPDDLLPNLGIGFFRDMFTVAVILKEYDWAENFVNEYSGYLAKELTETENNFCKGILNFKRGNYERSLSHFNKVKMIDIIEKINIRFYYMMNYIELKSYESALSALHTIKQFSHDRKDIPEMFAVLIPDALRYFHEIIKCEEEGRKADGLIYQDVFSGKRFYHMAYVMDKMEKLK